MDKDVKPFHVHTLFHLRSDWLPDRTNRQTFDSDWIDDEEKNLHCLADCSREEKRQLQQLNRCRTVHQHRSI